MERLSLQHQHIDCNGESIDHYYLCNYRPQYTGTDDLSKSLIRFKMRSRIDVEAWTECTMAELKKLPFQEGVLILRALSSDEEVLTTSKRTALDWLATKLAGMLNGNYQPQLLRKSRTTRGLKYLSLDERLEELRDVYVFHGDYAFKDILIVDDILTSGTTLKEIAKAIRKVNDSITVRFFTLASTDYQADLNQTIVLSGRSYSWQEDEWKVLTDKEEFYVNLERLKTKILNDFKT